ncbi:MAG TPA: GNAT family N-acetyltransferase [Bacillota bacterium]
MEVRPYAPGDEAAIRALFRLAFGREMQPDEWRWRFLDNPVHPGRTFIHLMWDGTVLAGHYAVSPVRMRLAGREGLAALSMTTMTHPAYGGRGVFTALAGSVYGALADAGFRLVWGFPNENSHYGFVRKLGWVDIYQVPMLSARLPARRMPVRPSPQVRPVATFDERFDDLWSEALQPFPNCIVRSAAHLNWRYLEHPRRPYQALALWDGTRPLGYVIYKFFRSGAGELQGDLVDLVLPADAEAAAELLGHACHRLAEGGARAVNLWLNPRHPAHGLLEKWGFEPGAPVTWLGGRVLDGLLGTAAIDRFQDWYITMGDSDVF